MGVAATFELDLGQETSAPTETRQHGGVSSQVEPLTLPYAAGLDQATFEIGGETMAYTVGGLNFTHMFIRTRAVNVDTSVGVGNLFYNAVPVGDSSFADGNASGINYLVLEVADPLSGFVLTGDATLTWSGNVPTQSRLAFQLKLVGVTEFVSTESPSFGSLEAVFGN